MTRFQTRGGWSLDPSCPCDLHLVDYFTHRRHARRVLFHMGSGLHHHVGRELCRPGRDNQVVSITTSRDEMLAYVDAVIEDPGLGSRYRVLFGDIYSLSPPVLPRFDVVALFHLCEPPDAVRPDIVPDAMSLVRTFLDRLRPGGEILFYRDSTGKNLTGAVLGSLVAMRRIVRIGDYKSLMIYGRPGPEGDQAGPDRGTGPEV